MNLEELAAALRDTFDHRIITVGGTPITLFSVVAFVAAFTTFMVIARLIGRWIGHSIRRRTAIGQGVSYALSRVVQYLIVGIGLLVSFQFLGIDLSSLAIVLGALGVGVGLGLQNIAANFVSGLILLLERPVRVGDRARIGDLEGDVEEINLRSTTVRSLLNVAVIVPNSSLTNDMVINLSLGDPRIVVKLEVGVSYDSDLDRVLRALQDVAESHPRVLSEPQPSVRLVGFGDSAWDMAVFAWIGDVKDYYAIRSELYESIVRAFRAQHIEIPFPQRDLHLRTPLPTTTG